jgi:hypothetical protein
VQPLNFRSHLVLLFPQPRMGIARPCQQYGDRLGLMWMLGDQRDVADAAM